MAKMPYFKLTLEERKSPHMLETKPRYDVMVNGVKKGELYFNMRGYRGALPDVRGSRLDPGEVSISAFRKEAARINREAKEVLAAAAADRRVVLETYEATEPDKVLVAVGEAPVKQGSAPIVLRTVARRDWELARIFFGHDQIPGVFLEDAEPGEMAPGSSADSTVPGSGKVLAAIQTVEPYFVLLAIGQPPEGMAGRTMKALPQDEVPERVEGFAWLTYAAWRELESNAGRGLVDAGDLPLIEGRSLSPNVRPEPLPAPGQEWVHGKMPADDLEEATGIGM